MRSEPDETAAYFKARVEKHGDRTHALREGRGFSRSEISDAGISLVEARFHGIRVDSRRRSKRDENIADLKKWVARVRKVVKAPKRPKKRPRVKEKPEEGAVIEKHPTKKPRKRKVKTVKKTK
ncbi:MAG: ribosomal protein L13e [Nitrososphaeria archaeon]